MRFVIAAISAGAVYLAVSLPTRQRISVRVGDYLNPSRNLRVSARSTLLLDWIQGEHTVNRLIATAAGVLAGLLVAQGDLFVQGRGRSALPLALLGGIGSWLVFGMHRSANAQRRGRRIRFELPVVADTLALHIVAGESVGTAIERFVEESDGVAADELSSLLSTHQGGLSLTEALQQAGTATADDEAQRLYALLAHAHDTGGRLAESLTELSTDYRAALSRDLTAEGGKRALATYGPVLALMVPVTLLFLMYPMLAGLRSLAGNP
jgi:tight adherence protein C